jgi:hypothetical protein
MLHLDVASEHNESPVRGECMAGTEEGNRTGLRGEYSGCRIPYVRSPAATTPRQNLATGQQVEVNRHDRPGKGSTPRARLGESSARKRNCRSRRSTGNASVRASPDPSPFEGKLDCPAAFGFDLHLTDGWILVRRRSHSLCPVFIGANHSPRHGHGNRIPVAYDKSIAAHVRETNRSAVVCLTRIVGQVGTGARPPVRDIAAGSKQHGRQQHPANLQACHVRTTTRHNSSCRLFTGELWTVLWDCRHHLRTRAQPSQARVK